MRKILSLCAAMLMAFAANAAAVVLPATLDVSNVSFRSEGMPDFVIADGEEYAGTYFDMGAHDSSNDTLLYAEWDVTIEPIKYNIAVDVYNTNSWRVQLHLLTLDGDTVKDLRYKGSSGQKGQFAIGSIDMSDLPAGDYKLRARAATAWSAMKLKDVIFEADYQGVNVDLPGTLTPAYALLSANASISGGAIAFKPSTAPDEYATWNVSFADAGEFNVSIDITASNGHNYGVALLSEDGATEIAALNEGGQKGDTGEKELGSIEVPAAGKYVIKLTNAIQWSEAVLNSITFAAPVVALTEPDALPTVPTWPNKQVKAVYSDTYGADCGFGEWGSGTTYTQDTYGKKFVTTDLGYFGLTFEGDAALNCSEMEKLNLSVWIAEDASIRVVPIHGNPEVGVTRDLIGQQWNYLEFALTEFDNGVDWTNTYQIKIDNAKNLTFWVNDVYFSTSVAPAVDDEKPTNFTAVVDAPSYFSANIKANAEDNSGVVIFNVIHGELIMATAKVASGADAIIHVPSLPQNASIDLKVIAKDEDGNEADPIVVTVNTLEAPAAAPAPEFAEEDVLSLYSNAYAFAPASLNSYNENWWNPTTMDQGDIEGNEVLFYAPKADGMIGWQFAEIDATGFQFLHIDIYPLADGSIEIYPVNNTDPKGEYKQTFTLTGNEWNHIVYDLTDKDLSKIIQIGWINYYALNGFLIDNVYFAKKADTKLSLTEFITEKPASEVVLKDLTVIFANGKNTYVIDEDGVALVIYDASKTYYDGTLEAGKVLSGQKAKYTAYNNQDEIVPTNTAAVSDGIAPVPTLLVAEPTEANVNQYVRFAKVQAVKNTEDNKYYIFDGHVLLYGATGSLKPTEDGDYDMEGIIINFKGNQIELIVTAIQKSSTSAVENFEKAEATKIMRNGQMYIIRDGKMYNVVGAEVK